MLEWLFSYIGSFLCRMGRHKWTATSFDEWCDDYSNWKCRRKRCTAKRRKFEDLYRKEPTDD